VLSKANQFLRVIGKGNTERRLPLPQPVLDGLRKLWKTHRNPKWLFPNNGFRSAKRQLRQRSPQKSVIPSRLRSITPAK
jgi:integrase